LKLKFKFLLVVLLTTLLGLGFNSEFVATIKSVQEKLYYLLFGVLVCIDFLLGLYVLNTGNSTRIIMAWKYFYGIAFLISVLLSFVDHTVNPFPPTIKRDMGQLRTILISPLPIMLAYILLNLTSPRETE